MPSVHCLSLPLSLSLCASIYLYVSSPMSTIDNKGSSKARGLLWFSFCFCSGLLCSVLLKGNERKPGASKVPLPLNPFWPTQKRRVLKSPRCPPKTTSTYPPFSLILTLIHIHIHWENASSLAPNARCNNFCAFCCFFHGGLSMKKQQDGSRSRSNNKIPFPPYKVIYMYIYM